MTTMTESINLTEGAIAPDFTLPNQDGINVSLKDFAGKWLVLYFYPRDNTPGCTIEAKDFTSLAPRFKKLGVSVVGVSPDSVKSHCNFIEKQDLKITLLSDTDKEVVIRYGAWGMKNMYGKESEGLIRSTFIISPDGRVSRAWTKVRAEGHAEIVLETVKRLLSA
jgi:peroxiredoxin Q/BCP